MTIFLSAGHHSEKQGARNRWFYEHPEAIHWQHCLAYYLGALAVEVPNGYLKRKVAFINEKGTAKDLALEVHFNSAVDDEGNPVGRGSETLFYPGSNSGRMAAERVQEVLAKYYPPNRGAKEGYYQMDPSNGPDYFLARIPMPALILEPDFIHRRARIIENREPACQDLAKALRDIHLDIRNGII